MNIKYKVILPNIALFLFGPMLWALTLIYIGLWSFPNFMQWVVSIPAVIFISAFLFCPIFWDFHRLKFIRKYNENSANNKIKAEGSIKLIPRMFIILGLIFISTGPLISFYILANPQFSLVPTEVAPFSIVDYILSVILAASFEFLFIVPLVIISIKNLEIYSQNINLSKHSKISLREKLITSFLFTILGIVFLLVSSALLIARHSSGDIFSILVEKLSILSGAAFIFSAIILKLMLDQIVKPVTELSNIMVEIDREANLTKRSHIINKDEIGEMSNKFNLLIDVLNKIVFQIKNSANQITTGSNQISDSSQSLSLGASKQAASLEEITASINEITSQVQLNVENSRKTCEITIKTNNDAINSNNKMKELINAMENINKSAQEIKNIVKVIDDIAFQTNLLALNADIEAARVGKYGRGFAVVANSVRTLAGKSAEAVKETTSMVDRAIKNVEQGNELVKKAAEQLENITNASTEATKLATEVAYASQEQANSIEQISTSLGQIEDVIQSNSASAEENAAATEELASQASQLREIVSYFKVNINELSS